MACRVAAHDVNTEACISFYPVVLIEYSEMADIGTLRLEPGRMVFAGGSMTRCVPFGSIVLMGTQPMLGEPERNACSVNSSEHPATMLFLADEPMEFHLSAWYSRWLHNPFTEFTPRATVPAITTT